VLAGGNFTRVNDARRTWTRVLSLATLVAQTNASKRRLFDMDEAPPRPSRAQELKAFLLLAVLMGPVLAVVVVSGYGFLVWMFQLLAGPPGPRM
jgi:nitrate reductase NapE